MKHRQRSTIDRAALVPPLPAESLDPVPEGVVGHHHLAGEAGVRHGAGVVVPQPGLQRSALVAVPVLADHRVDHELDEIRTERGGDEGTKANVISRLPTACGITTRRRMHRRCGGEKRVKPRAMTAHEGSTRTAVYERMRRQMRASDVHVRRCTVSLPHDEERLAALRESAASTKKRAENAAR